VPGDRDPQPVRTFGVFTADLRALAAWLKQCGVTTVVVESTGVYWMPLCDFLEAQGFEVLVIDPRSLARNLKKKTDVSDAAWLQELHAFGLLKSCFRPDQEVRALRTLWRHRDHLVTEAAKLLQMMQKVLVQMNVYLHLAVADIAGVTGMRILRAIAQGQHDPQTLAAMRDPNCKKSKAEIAKALEGTWDPAHPFELKQLLKAWDFYQNQLQVCDKEYAKAAGKMPDQSQGRPLPEPEKRTNKHRNCPKKRSNANVNSKPWNARHATWVCKSSRFEPDDRAMHDVGEAGEIDRKTSRAAAPSLVRAGRGFAARLRYQLSGHAGLVH
jgi:transposase